MLQQLCDIQGHSVDVLMKLKHHSRVRCEISEGGRRVSVMNQLMNSPPHLVFTAAHHLS